MNHLPPDSIRTALDDILPRVQKPTRYLGIERNLIRKTWETTDVRVALAFPDAYEIGMSHQGTRILYHLINRRPDALAERTFAPMPDMAQALREAGLPLFTLESYRSVAEFDAVGISLQSELNYINIPYILDLAGIPRRAADRADGDPIVLGGGPCTANPEPVADFFDAILIGDGEAALDRILDVIRDGRADGAARALTLERLAAVPGVYVPVFYDWHPPSEDSPARWETSNEDAPFPVKRVWVDQLDPADQPESVIVPFADVIQDRLGMEIMRGCTQGCRFCQAGYWYRPVREQDPEIVADRIERQIGDTGFSEVGLLSLSTADYSQVEPLVYNLAERLQNQRVSVSLPSLRADSFSVGLAEAVSRVRKSGFTFAPETGSDRLRRVINKTFTNADMVRAAESAFSKGLAADQGLRHDRAPDRDRRRSRGAGPSGGGHHRRRPPRHRRPQGPGQGLGGLLHPQGLDALPVAALCRRQRAPSPHQSAQTPFQTDPRRQTHLVGPRGVGARITAVPRRPRSRRRDRKGARPGIGVRRVVRPPRPGGLAAGARRLRDRRQPRIGRSRALRHPPLGPDRRRVEKGLSQGRVAPRAPRDGDRRLQVGPLLPLRHSRRRRRHPARADRLCRCSANRCP